MKKQFSNEQKKKIEELLNKYPAEKTVIGKPSQELIEAYKEKGMNIEQFNRKLEQERIKHFIKEHGDSKKEESRGQIAIEVSDIDKINDIANNAEYGYAGVKGKDGNTYNIYGLNMENGNAYMIEHLRKKKNELTPVSFMKLKHKINDSNFDNITIKTGNKFDLTNAKKLGLKGTGSHPGDSAQNAPSEASVTKPTDPNKNISQTLLDVKEKNIEKISNRKL